MSEQIKVLLDTDIGTDIDDAVALAYLLCQERCDLVGITTVTGEADRRAEMASAICRHAGRDDVPIHAGCTQALLIDMPQQICHQGEALGQWDRRRDFPPATAIVFMQQCIRENPGEITLLTIGPLTNAAALFAVDPEIPSLLKQMVMMCGRFFSDNPGAEWNALNDPHATAMAYGCARRADPPRHVSYGLDVTNQCRLPAGDCKERFSAKVLEPVLDFAEVWFREREQITFHDPLAAACIFEPDLCGYRTGKVTVGLDDPAGRTLLDDQPDGPHHVAETVQADAFLDHYFSVVH